MTFPSGIDEWACPYEPTSGEKSSVDKIALAREVTQKVDLAVFDLQAKVEALADFIRVANG